MIQLTLILFLFLFSHRDAFVLQHPPVKKQAHSSVKQSLVLLSSTTANESNSDSSSSSSTSSATTTTKNHNKVVDIDTNKYSFNDFPTSSSHDCSDTNIPPSLSTILDSIYALPSGSDIRGTFMDHSRLGSILNISSVLSSPSASSTSTTVKPKAYLTPFAAFCYGNAFAKMVQIRSGRGSATTTIKRNKMMDDEKDDDDDDAFAVRDTIICVGVDPREHGVRLADALCRGIESIPGVKAVYTGLATTPSMFEFCRADLCDGGVMVTASHLPQDRNGMKFFTKTGGLTHTDIQILAESASSFAKEWHDIGIIPPTSGNGAVYCSSWVDFMPHYKSTLRRAILREVSSSSTTTTNDNDDSPKPLKGLRIVLNAGNGSGSFFEQVLKNLGADTAHSIHLNPNGTFPSDTGVPNPEYKPMMDATIKVCRECHADLGIMLDTDADRSGFIVPRTINSDGTKSDYEPLNRNRLIALLSVSFASSSPGCTIVTDSVTSEGLSHFLERTLQLHHVRYLKGYANVIGKARELTESGRALAEMAIETSGHCAMRENGYLDDGTYTAVKVISLLAQVKNDENGSSGSLLDLISELQEMEEVNEFRMNVLDGSIVSTGGLFEQLCQLVENACEVNEDWVLDVENLEGVRVRNLMDGGFFMVRKSLHDPLISVQVEGSSVDSVRKVVIGPLVRLMEEGLGDSLSILDLKPLLEY